ncbi:MAG: type II secretion system secretin GspD, partial [Arenimonas sp.]|uniref:type II secretion system secretin GspD n=1 Tax=Arenimonas sp. TaxID=1872635 RepID=UPI0025B9B86C
MNRSLRVVSLSLLLATAPLNLHAQAAPKEEALNLQGADLRAFIQDVSRATGSKFILDPRVQGNVTISSEEALSPSDLLGVLLVTLRAHGLVAIPAGNGTYRVVPDETAAQQPASAGAEDGQGFATMVVPLRNVDARTAAETLKPLVGRGGVVAPTPQGNSLLIADYADNLRRLRGLVGQIDQDRSDIRIVTLRNSAAREIAAVLAQLTAVPGGPDGARAGTLSVIPVDSSNSLMLRGDPLAVERMALIVADLDERAETSGDVRVVRLQHANAEQLLPVLQQIMGQPATDTAVGTEATGAAAAPAAPAVGARRTHIARFPGANAIVISADAETQRTLADVIRQLDTRREQVLVEAIVVEVSDGMAKNLGVQFLLAGKDGNVPFAASNFPGSSPGILPLAGAAATDPDAEPGSSEALLRQAALQSLLGTSGGLLGLAGSSSDALFGVIINAVKSDSASNLLSTPSILTLDNEEARILVGQEVPITTGEVLGDANSNPFRTTTRQDVGIQLEVKPQINSGGGITLFLRQEVSAVAGTISARSDDLILNKREIETTVLVDDGNIVVLGGLLDQGDQLSVDKIPVLGDLPAVGGLFRNKRREANRTNLMVFIRPTIIRDA